MLYFTLTKVMNTGFPASVLLEVIGDVTRSKDMPGIAAIHDSLRHVNTCAGDIRAIVQVSTSLTGPL
jgi:hypothetical protein